MLTFDSDSHTYKDGGKTLISVTQLLKKHGLAPDYGDVPDYVLEAKAKRGELIHKEIHDYLQSGDTPITDEAMAAIKWLNERNSLELGSECMVSNDIVAGTFDYLGWVGPDKTLIDWKTTAKFDESYLSWQLSLYDYLGHMNCSKLVCAHLKGSEIAIHEVRKHPRSEIEALLEAERKGEAFVSESDRKALELANCGSIAELEEIESVIIEHERIISEAKRRQKQIKDALIKSMSENDVRTFETDRLKVTLVKATQREELDKEALKRDYLDIYSRYTKTVKIKPSIRIKLKGEKEDAQQSDD